MSRLNEPILQAFRDELRKEAGFADAVARSAPMLKNVGSGAGVGALAGGVAGAIGGGVRGYRDAREAGDSVGGAAISALGQGLGGGAHGALLGGALGAGAGAVGHHFGGGTPSRLTARNDIIGSAARSGQRQIHSLTGMLSPSELEGVRGGAYDARQSLGKLRAAGKPTARAEKAVDWADRAQGAGLTSIPGYLRSVQKNGLGKTLATSVKEQYHGSPTLNTLLIGGSLVGAGKTLAAPENPDGPGKGEAIGRGMGWMIGGVAGGLMPFAGSAVLGEGAGRAGGAVGRVIDRIRGRKPLINDLGNRAPLEPTEAQSTPSERIESPSVAGGQKDIGL